MLSRACPECKSTISYASIRSAKRAIRNGSLCNSCRQRGDKNYYYKTGPSNNCRQARSVVMAGNQNSRGAVRTAEFRESLSHFKTGQRLSMTHKAAISAGMSKRWQKHRELNPPLEKPWTQGQLTAWANRVKQRDNYICQLCLTSEGTLHAHHIKPKGLYPDIALDVANGVTLCWDCHKEEHKA